MAEALENQQGLLSPYILHRKEKQTENEEDTGYSK